MLHHRTAFLGIPGTGKSVAGLSYPGVEMHEFGSSEFDTALGFVGRTDILPPVKLDWFDCLSEEEKAKFTNEQVNEVEIGLLTKRARAKNIARYRRYLYGLKKDLLEGKRSELQTIFLDNFTPFSLDFQDYVEIVYGQEFITEKGNFNSIKFSIKYQQEVSDFLRFLVTMPCHVVLSCHVSMTVDEETAAKASFMEDTKKGIRYAKEWTPLIMGKSKYVFTGIFTWAFFLYTEERPGLSTRYFAKLEADSSTVGIGKSRVQPFVNPRQIEFPRCRFYPVFQQALEAYLKEGKLVANPDGRSVGSA
mgnify:CR=1 FL=1